MRSLLGTLCALSVFAATGYSLSCTQCLNLNGISCSGASVTCSTNQVCASVLLSVSIPALGYSNRDMFARACAPQGLCNLNGSFSFPSSKVTYASSCCSTDNCTPTLPTIPDNINQPNGLTCPTCLSYDGSLCDASQSIPCTGNENTCYLEAAIAPVPTGFYPIVARGCASKSVCDTANVEQLFILNYLGVNSYILCTPAAYGTSTATTTAATNGTSTATTTAGYSLSCTQCLNVNGTTCSDANVTCPTNQVCASVLLRANIPALGYSNRDMFARACAPQELCNLNGSFSFPSSKVTYASSCCSTDNCTSTLPTIPDNINQPNGLTCPTCLSYNGSLCDASQSIPCTGNENTCYLEAAIAPGFYPILARGCASKSVCDIANVEQLFIHNSLGYNANTLCTPAASNGTTPGTTPAATTAATTAATNGTSTAATTKATPAATNAAFDVHHGFLLPAAIFTALIKFMFG